MAILVSKTELARIAGVAKPSISKACQRNFPAALVGLRVDVEHPDVQRYLQDKDGAATRLAALLAMPPPAPTGPTPSSDPPVFIARPSQSRGAERRTSRNTEVVTTPSVIDLAAVMDMTIREVYEAYGTFPQFIDVLDATRRVADITERNLKIAERTGRLISREFVRSHVFSHLDALARRFLTDVPVTLTRKLYAAALANVVIEQSEETVREHISSQLQKTKAEVTRALAHGERDEREHAA